MFDFLVDRGVKVVLQAIAQPPSDFASPVEVFEKSTEHEKKVTALINGIADQAEKSNDHPTKVFIQWFITEQVEEEKNALRILDLLRTIPPNSAGIFQLDHQLGKREWKRSTRRRPPAHAGVFFSSAPELLETPSPLTPSGAVPILVRMFFSKEECI
jgi:ferritin